MDIKVHKVVFDLIELAKAQGLNAHPAVREAKELIQREGRGLLSVPAIQGAGDR